MASAVQKLTKQGVIQPPKFMPTNIHYEVLMGSIAYGVSNNNSDCDVYGWCIPPKDMIFPHLRGEIPGFGTQLKRFEQFDPHHVKDINEGKEYDFAIYNIVKYFQLCMNCNPNMIDSLFVPNRCIIHITDIGQMVRDRRRDFLHKGSWHTFKGYAYSQRHKMESKNPEGKRKEMIDKYGYDLKFAYHIVRLMNEVEQILVEYDIDLERNREELKAIRRGEWSVEQVHARFNEKEQSLEKLYVESKLPYAPDEEKIKQLLLDCLEHHFGNLSNSIVKPNQLANALGEMQTVINKYNEYMKNRPTAWVKLKNVLFK